MLLIAMALQAFLTLVVGLGLAIGGGQTARWLAASHGDGWLVAGAALEAVLTALLLLAAGKSARTSGTSFFAAVTIRGGANRYEATCIAVPVYALLLCAAVAAGYSVALGRAAIVLLLAPRLIVP